MSLGEGAMAPVAVMEASCLSKRYRADAPYALRDFSARFSTGELVALIGHNGAGKSTLFDILGGLMRPTAGSLETHIHRSQMGWCPQREIIDWSLTVRQNITMGLELRRGSRGVAREVDATAALLGLEPYLGRTAETLSGGELRRTQIARAMAGEPQLMILDEPSTGLDPSAIDTVFAHLASRVANGATALVSTHETSKFARYCTRVIALERGAVVVDMPAQEFMAYAPSSNDLWDAYQVCVKEREEP